MCFATFYHVSNVRHISNPISHHPQGTNVLFQPCDVMWADRNCGHNLLPHRGDTLNHPGGNILGQNSILVVKSKYKAPETKLFHRALRWLSGKNTQGVIRLESGATAAYKKASAVEIISVIFVKWCNNFEEASWKDFLLCVLVFQHASVSNRDLQVFQPLGTVS